MAKFSSVAVKERDGLRIKLESWVNKYIAYREKYYKENFPKALDLTHYELELREGDRFIRVFFNEHSRETGEYLTGSIYAFIDKTNGDVLKPAGVKTPAQKARGNLFDEHNGLRCMGPYGVLNAR